ncbi:MAG: hypothetical protein GF320_06410 [Armatimonadia bacterium]|nr:hypothetical protein [Armatimonadia bacterium]
MKRYRVATAFLAVLCLVLGGLVAAQPGGRPGGPRGFGGGPGPAMIFGTITSADVGNGLIKVDMGGNERTVYPVRATELLEVVSLSAEDLAVGDEVHVSGVPTGIWATRLAVDSVGFADDDGPGGGMGMPMMGGFGMGSMAMASGTVTALEPLTVQFTQDSAGAEQEFQVIVTLAEDASLSSVVAGQWDAVQAGTMVFGMATRDEQDRLVLDTLVVIDDPEVLQGMMGRGMGGPPGRRGGR